MTKIIALDAGHGLFTYGKQDPNGIKEWQYNDKVLRAVVRHLDAHYSGFKIVRLDDPTGKVDVPLMTRTNKAKSAGAHILVSIHHNANSGNWGSWGGVETFVQTPLSNNPKSHALAKEVHPRLVKAMGLRDRGIKPNNLHMTREPVMPSILTEGGFMDSLTDNPVMRDDKKLEAQGKAIAEGIADYLNLAKKATVVKPQVEKPKPVAPVKETIYMLFREKDGKGWEYLGSTKTYRESADRALWHVANGYAVQIKTRLV